MFGSDLSRTIDGNIFLQSCRKFVVGGQCHEVVIWASQESLSILRQNHMVLIDGTFRAVPRPYVQCLMFMAFDVTTDVYVPCVWILMTARTERLYRHVFQDIQSLLDWRWLPNLAVADFEYPLLVAIQTLLRTTRIIGCFFHFKQSLVRKLVKLHVDRQQASQFAASFDFLTVINRDRIERALEHIRMNSNLDPTITDTFIQYFKRTWMRKYPPQLWNIHGLDNHGVITRTNNPLERYNRRLNEQFGNAHPNLVRFVAAIRSEENLYSMQIRDIRQGRLERPGGRNKFELPSIPDGF